MAARLLLLVAVVATTQSAVPLVVPLALFVAWAALTLAAILARKQVR